jgi:hypothetical protein
MFTLIITFASIAIFAILALAFETILGEGNGKR